jgi:hypothetical protein
MLTRLASGTCAEDEGFSTNRRIELIKSMNSASGWLYKRRFLVGEVEDLVNFLAMSEKNQRLFSSCYGQVYSHSDILRESTRYVDT